MFLVLAVGALTPRQFLNSNTRGDAVALHKALHFHTSFCDVCKPSSSLSVVQILLSCVSGRMTAKKSREV